MSDTIYGFTITRDVTKLGVRTFEMYRQFSGGTVFIDVSKNAVMLKSAGVPLNFGELNELTQAASHARLMLLTNVTDLG